MKRVHLNVQTHAHVHRTGSGALHVLGPVRHRHGGGHPPSHLLDVWRPPPQLRAAHADGADEQLEPRQF
eukprot:scaffold24572_cov65-Phaeocystis_antarctica.AAC.7